eukprot:525873-Amphidinium_carterae.10
MVESDCGGNGLSLSSSCNAGLLCLDALFGNKPLCSAMVSWPSTSTAQTDVSQSLLAALHMEPLPIDLS